MPPWNVASVLRLNVFAMWISVAYEGEKVNHAMVTFEAFSTYVIDVLKVKVHIISLI